MFQLQIMKNLLGSWKCLGNTLTGVQIHQSLIFSVFSFTVYSTGMFTSNLYQGWLWKALLREKWSKNPELLPGFKPAGNPSIQRLWRWPICYGEAQSHINLQSNWDNFAHWADPGPKTLLWIFWCHWQITSHHPLIHRRCHWCISWRGKGLEREDPHRIVRSDKCSSWTISAKGTIHSAPQTLLKRCGWLTQSKALWSSPGICTLVMMSSFEGIQNTVLKY